MAFERALEQSNNEEETGITAALAGTAVLGLLATTMVVVGGALAGAAGTPPSEFSQFSERPLWTVPTIPVRPSMNLVPALAIFFGGLLLLIRAWLTMRRQHLESGLQRRHVAAIILLWALPLLVGPPLASRDVYAYAAQGWAAEQGHDVYQYGLGELADDDPVLAPVDPLYRDTPVVYGPIFMFAAAQIAELTGGAVVQAVLAYRLMAVFGLTIAAVAVVDLAKGLRRDPTDALILGFANPLVLLHLVSGAHNESIMLAFLLTGVAIARRPGRELWGIGLAAMAAAIKLPAILAVAFVGWSWAIQHPTWPGRFQRLALSGGVALGVIAAAGRLTGWGWGWVDAITGTNPVEAYLSVSNVLGAGFALLTGLDPDQVLSVARPAGVLVGAVIVMALLVRRYHNWPLALAWSLLVAAVLHPTTQPWYLTWGLMLLAACSAGERNRLVVGASAVAVVLVLPAGPELGWLLLGEIGFVTLGVALIALAMLTVSIGPRPAPHRRRGLDRQLVSVVVPTRHEAPNVDRLVHDIAAAMSGRVDDAGPELGVEVIFVDDSDDETPEVVATVADSWNADDLFSVRLLHREPAERWGGLGGAVVEGLAVARGAHAVVMDADGQHQASVIPDLVAALQGGASVAVASRRVDGGSDNQGLSASRRWLSKVVSQLCMLAFPRRVGRVSDPLSGFFGVRLDQIDLAVLQPDGFKILLEILATHGDLAATEVPLVFVERAGGVSKANLSEGLLFLGHLVDLRLRTSRVWSGIPHTPRTFRSVEPGA